MAALSNYQSLLYVLQFTVKWLKQAWWGLLPSDPMGRYSLKPSFRAFTENKLENAAQSNNDLLHLQTGWPDGGNLPLQEMRTEEAVLLLSITSAPPQQSSQCRSHSDKSRNIRNVLKPKTFPLLRVNHSNSLDAKQPLFSSLCIIWLPLPLCLRTLQWVTAAEVFTDPLLNNPPAKI